jgi:septal ring factor EnvC (AmiA/AmiB activator)
MNTLWQKLSDFLHQANLIPLVVVVSVYHYYQALRLHDPFFVAVPMALFVDLLHFRTVQRALKSGAWGWKATAVLTTAIAFGLQWLFYSAPSAAGVTGWWQTLLFASLVPVGLAIMAWHHEAQAQDETVNWQTQLAAVRGTLQKEQSRTAALESEITAVHKEMAAARERVDQATQHQAELVQVQQQATAVRQQLAAEQAQTTKLRAEIEEMAAVQKAWRLLNEESQTLALFNAGQLPLETAAEQLGLHASTIRRKAKRLNGVGDAG